MRLDSAETLIVQDLRLLHHAELQISNAVPDMTRAAFSGELKAIFGHINRREHLRRLEWALDDLRSDPIGEQCDTMGGLIADVQLRICEGGDPQLVDLALIGGNQQIGHFLIASYCAAYLIAKHLRKLNAAKLLAQSLQDEKNAAIRLTKLSKSLMKYKAFPAPPISIQQPQYAGLQ